METRPFSYDPLTKTTRLFHYDHATDDFFIETISDVEDIVELNKAFQNDDVGRFENFHRVASIPMSIYWQLVAAGIADDPDAMKRWLNDRDNRAFRTKLGRV